MIYNFRDVLIYVVINLYIELNYVNVDIWNCLIIYYNIINVWKIYFCVIGFFLMFFVYFWGEYFYNLNLFKWDNLKKNCNLEKSG